MTEPDSDRRTTHESQSDDGDSPSTNSGVDGAAVDSSSRIDRQGVVVNGVGKTYRDGGPVRALDDVTFTVDEGEFVCLVGPSGCGKTTLFRVIAGLTDPTDGHVLVNGNPVTEPTTDLGVVFQEYHLFPWLTVAENVAFGLERSEVEESERAAWTDENERVSWTDENERVSRTDEMLELVGLADFRDTYPKSLSGGMKQRVGIARALAVDPDLLLMDEPFGAVDAQTREMLQHELLDIWASTRKTVLFVTHDVDEAVTLADRIVVMAAEPGRVREVVTVNVDRPRQRDDPAFGNHVARIRELIGATR